MLLDATTPNSETDTKNENQEPEPASAVQGKDAVASVTKQSDIQEIRKETRSAVLFVDDDEAPGCKVPPVVVGFDTVAESLQRARSQGRGGVAEAGVEGSEPGFAVGLMVLLGEPLGGVLGVHSNGVGEDVSGYGRGREPDDGPLLPPATSTPPQPSLTAPLHPAVPHSRP